RQVPGRKVDGKEYPRQKQEEIVAQAGGRFIALPGDPRDQEERQQGQRHTPEGGGHRAYFRKTHEDRRAADGDASDEKGDQGKAGMTGGGNRRHGGSPEREDACGLSDRAGFSQRAP